MMSEASAPAGSEAPSSSEQCPSSAYAAERQFAEDGYFLFRDVIPESVLSTFRSEISERVDSFARELVARGLAPRTFDELPFERRLDALCVGWRRLKRPWDEWLFCRSLWQLATHPALVERLSTFIGPDVTYQGNGHLRPHFPGPLEPWPWHQDAQFYGTGTEHLLWNMVQAWIPLVDAGTENGCMALVPGSHRWGLLDGAVPGGNNVTESTAERQRLIYGAAGQAARGKPVVMLPMRPGDILFFTCLTVHTGTPNRSRTLRWSIDLRFETTRGTRPTTALEAAAYERMHRRLRGRGYVPLRVRRPAGDPESWESWVARRIGHAPSTAVIAETTGSFE